MEPSDDLMIGTISIFKMKNKGNSNFSLFSARGLVLASHIKPHFAIFVEVTHSLSPLRVVVMRMT